jgi:hypothetical protein
MVLICKSCIRLKTLLLVAPYVGSRCRSRKNEATNWNFSSMSASHKKRVEPLVHEMADNQPSLSVLVTGGALGNTKKTSFQEATLDELDTVTDRPTKIKPAISGYW